MLSKHIEDEHIDDNLNIKLLDNSQSAAPCDTKSCKIDETTEVLCKHSHHPAETLSTSHTSAFFGLPSVYTVTYNQTKSTARATAKPVIFSDPILRYLNYLLYPVAYFPKKVSNS